MLLYATSLVMEHCCHNPSLVIMVKARHTPLTPSIGKFSGRGAYLAQILMAIYTWFQAHNITITKYFRLVTILNFVPIHEDQSKYY